MNNFTNFKKLSKVGDEGEQKFVEFLEREGFTDIKHVDDIPGANQEDFDIQATNHEGTWTFEVKNQPNCHEFGAINIEMVQNRSWGAIALSKSDFFVFVNPELGFGFVRTEELKECGRAVHAHPKYSKKAFAEKEILRINGENVHLWKTDFDNPAYGFKYKTDWIEWKR